MTILIDDAGYGDLLFGTVIGAYRLETDHFIYDVIGVKHFKDPLYTDRTYIREASRIAQRLVERLRVAEDEKIQLCRGDILNEAEKGLAEIYGEDRVERVKVEGRAQELVEQAYLDELLNIGYKAREDRTERWAKSFWDMYRWVARDRRRLRWAKTGPPKLKRYKLFRNT